MHGENLKLFKMYVKSMNSFAVRLEIFYDKVNTDCCYMP